MCVCVCVCVCIDVRGIFCDRVPAGESDRRSFFADSSGHRLMHQTSSERKGFRLLVTVKLHGL